MNIGAVPSGPFIDPGQGDISTAWRFFLLNWWRRPAIAAPVSTIAPTWTHGVGAPTATQPLGSLYSRDGGAVGSTLYVSRGAGVWNAVAGV